MARSELREGAKTGKAPVEVAKPHELDDPQRQAEILNPETLRYTLLFEQTVIDERIVNGKKTRAETVETVKRAIVLPTQFTLGDIVTRRIKDDVASFTQLVMTEMQRTLPASVTLSEALTTKQAYFAAAVLSGPIAERLREIVAKVGRFEDEPSAAPTFEQIGDGMDTTDLGAIGMVYVLNQIIEVQNRKNARAAALG